MNINSRLDALERTLTPQKEPLLVWIERYSETDKTKVRAGDEVIDLGREMEPEEAQAHAMAILRARNPGRAVYALSWEMVRDQAGLIPPQMAGTLAQ